MFSSEETVREREGGEPYISLSELSELRSSRTVPPRRLFLSAVVEVVAEREASSIGSSQSS